MLSLAAALTLGSCSAGEVEQKSYIDNKGRRCTIDPEQNARARCDTVAFPTTECTSGTTGCFTVWVDVQTYHIRNCATCCAGETPNSPLSFDCAPITCRTDKDCVYPDARCEAEFCYRRPAQGAGGSAGAAGSGGAAGAGGSAPTQPGSGGTAGSGGIPSTAGAPGIPGNAGSGGVGGSGPTQPGFGGSAGFGGVPGAAGFGGTPSTAGSSGFGGASSGFGGSSGNPGFGGSAPGFPGSAGRAGGAGAGPTPSPFG